MNTNPERTTQLSQLKINHEELEQGLNEKKIDRNTSQNLFANLIREIAPADTVMWRTTSDSFTAGELCQHIEQGTETGQQYSSDVLRVARDFLKRKANREIDFMGVKELDCCTDDDRCCAECLYFTSEDHGTDRIQGCHNETAHADYLIKYDDDSSPYYSVCNHFITEEDYLNSISGLGEPSEVNLSGQTEVYGNLLAKYKPKAIKTDEENEQAIAVAEEFSHRHNRTAEEDELLCLLIALIEKYEEGHYPMEKSHGYGSMAGQIIMSRDFDEPLEDLKEYM